MADIVVAPNNEVITIETDKVESIVIGSTNEIVSNQEIYNVVIVVLIDRTSTNILGVDLQESIGQSEYNMVYAKQTSFIIHIKEGLKRL